MWWPCISLLSCLSRTFLRRSKVNTLFISQPLQSGRYMSFFHIWRYIYLRAISAKMANIIHSYLRAFIVLPSNAEYFRANLRWCDWGRGGGIYLFVCFLCGEEFVQNYFVQLRIFWILCWGINVYKKNLGKRDSCKRFIQFHPSNMI